MGKKNFYIFSIISANIFACLNVFINWPKVQDWWKVDNVNSLCGWVRTFHFYARRFVTKIVERGKVPFLLEKTCAEIHRKRPIANKLAVQFSERVKKFLPSSVWRWRKGKVGKIWRALWRNCLQLLFEKGEKLQFTENALVWVWRTDNVRVSEENIWRVVIDCKNRVRVAVIGKMGWECNDRLDAASEWPALPCNQYSLDHLVCELYRRRHWSLQHDDLFRLKAERQRGGGRRGGCWKRGRHIPPFCSLLPSTPSTSCAV